jgi:hypothetical protein
LPLILSNKILPKNVFAAKKISVAPITALNTLKKVPGNVANKKPPVSDIIEAPGKENVTIVI